MNKTNIKRIFIVVLSVVCNVLGLLSLCNVNKWITVSALDYLFNLNFFVRYVIIIVTMSVGIMSFGQLAPTYTGKTKNTLAIVNCAYSTLLTIPLLLTFLMCFFAGSNPDLPIAGEVVQEMSKGITNGGVRYLLYTLGTIMSIVFLAVPIMMTVKTVKEK